MIGAIKGFVGVKLNQVFLGIIAVLVIGLGASLWYTSYTLEKSGEIKAHNAELRSALVFQREEYLKLNTILQNTDDLLSRAMAKLSIREQEANTWEGLYNDAINESEEAADWADDDIPNSIIELLQYEPSYGDGDTSSNSPPSIDAEAYNTSISGADEWRSGSVHKQTKRRGIRM